MKAFQSALAVPGTLARIGTWPAWEIRPGRPAPHPIVIYKDLGDRRVLIYPISHDRDLSPVKLPIAANISPFASKPQGPLETYPDVSYIHLKDEDGDSIGATAEVCSPDTIKFINPNYQFVVRCTLIVQLGAAWPALQELIRAKVR